MQAKTIDHIFGFEKGSIHSGRQMMGSMLFSVQKRFPVFYLVAFSRGDVELTGRPRAQVACFQRLNWVASILDENTGTPIYIL